jgi:hypothetical protein
MVHTALASRLDEVIDVLGHQAEEINVRDGCIHVDTDTLDDYLKLTSQ